MNKLNLVFAPDPVYKKISILIDIIDQDIITLANDMVEFTIKNHAYGVAAPMFGISKQIIVVNTQDQPIVMLNPEIISYSNDKETAPEGSLSFIGIEIEVSRSKSIMLKYMNLKGEICEIEADGIFARAIQHEYDYLIGKNILNYVSKLKQDMLIKKMEKYKKLGHIPHIHSSSCNH